MTAMNEVKIREQLAQRMSLRPPQKVSLDILGDVVNTIDLDKTPNLKAQLSTIQASYESVTDFERDFPSLCFALATGVGKTRLMGAFITYLFQTGKSQNFFVLAPNTTIYNKLIADFTPGTPKYVFKGIAEFVQTSPILVTGDTWDEGRGIRDNGLSDNEVIINIFNVDKINKDRGKIRKMHEIIGESYFDYLANLPDLVMLMDEAHRYRAKKAFRAIEELHPILGLELTATPKSVGAKPKPFKNVIYEYKLGNAMADGFVKVPAVVTRENFDPSSVSEEQLEVIKLEDAVHCHKNVKNKLIEFAHKTGNPLVHPFILIVAQDTAHASALKELITSNEFFGGDYAGKVIEIHSKTSGEESNKATELLLAVESDPNTEIVIHVNKLKEGWDVTNLYTIVPLRTSASDILTEQTLGRGLRLPYGRRLNNEAVDGLKIIAHDRFEAVIAEARKSDSLMQMKAVTVGAKGDIAPTEPVVIQTKPRFKARLTGIQTGIPTSQAPATGKQSGSKNTSIPTEAPAIPQEPFYTSTEDIELVNATIEVIQQQQYDGQLPDGLNSLKDPKLQENIVKTVTESTSAQSDFEGIKETPDISSIVSKVTEEFVNRIIEIPQITFVPINDMGFGFKDFDLEHLAKINYQPIDEDIQITTLENEERSYLARSEGTSKEDRLENYIVKHLSNFDEIDYGAHADLLNKLAGQMISHLRTYLDTDKEVENVCRAFGSKMAEEIFRQMKEHIWETNNEFTVQILRSFRVDSGEVLTAPSADHVRDFSTPVTPLSDTPKYIFNGFSEKACANHYKFDSDPERKFAVLIDKHTPEVKLWMRPSARSIEIIWESGKYYEPDFIVETNDEKLIVEVKADNNLKDAEVLKKAAAANQWIAHANKFAEEQGKKKWRYLLIPQSDMTENATLSGLIAKCTHFSE